MKLSKRQRERHRGAALELIARLEGRLTASAPAKLRGPQAAGLAERVGTFRRRLGFGLPDRDLVRLNQELADLFYRSNNADKRSAR